jgi:5-methyltetrahydrofolate--homocysteine methyltransferase
MGDSVEAEEIAREALEVTLGEALLFDLVVAPAMHRIGQLWESGEISIAWEGEQHVVALDMVGKLLESAGYEVMALGADVPTSALPAIVAEHHPTLFALSATMPANRERVPAAVDAVTGAADDICIVLGGASVPPSLRLRPGVVVERSVAGVVDAADGLVRRAGLN